MLNTLKELFQPSPNQAASSDHELKLAAATLMLELVRSDGEIQDIEIALLQDILRKEFELADSEVTQLIDLSQHTLQQSVSLQGFTREICQAWDNEKRVKMLTYLWMLALCDQQVDTHERHLVRKIAGLLYLNERQIILAKERAKQKITQ